MDQSEFEANTCNRRQAREKACDQVKIGFGFASHWLKKWREFCWPITGRSKAKLKQLPNYFRHSIENRSMKLVQASVNKGTGHNKIVRTGSTLSGAGEGGYLVIRLLTKCYLL